MRLKKLAIKSEKNPKYYRKCSNNFAADCTLILVTLCSTISIGWMDGLNIGLDLRGGLFLMVWQPPP